MVICHSCTNHVKGQIIICHSCTNHVKVQVVIRFFVTGVYGNHALFTCMEIKRANQKFWQTTCATPSFKVSHLGPHTFNLSQHHGLFKWVNEFFASGGQSIEVSALASILPMSIQDWFPLGWASWISQQSKGFSRVFSNTTNQKNQFFGSQLSL